MSSSTQQPDCIRESTTNIFSSRYIIFNNLITSSTCNIFLAFCVGISSMTYRTLLIKEKIPLIESGFKQICLEAVMI